jgi:hypothetical protein
MNVQPASLSALRLDYAGASARDTDPAWRLGAFQ